ncbi:RsmB/NOP family class I SAM-dependent RNA methyltransferase [Pelagibacteraceae bacterium]|nr:RsmB/NOP family class I SAM-dependent RNA methyltransferase [Pelagibacteraceae bacterium]
MIKGVKIRSEIHNILFSVYKFNKTLNNSSIKKKIESQKKEDISFLYNVVLNSMRFHLHCLKIINKYIKKKLRDQEKILLISAITQIVFLNFKDYAVINCSVEIAKKLKIYPGLINATLKKINEDKLELKKINVKYSDLPLWFQNNTITLPLYEKEKFLDNFYREPDIHIVFKNKNKLNNFDEIIIKTSDISGFLLNKKEISNKKSFVDGDWWVQDFSSFLPLNNFKIENKNKRVLDACAAPGGKSFQLLSRNINVISNDKSKSRIKNLKANLVRLKLSCVILNEDFTKLNEKETYDIIIIDAPCSAIGTIRKNPEIFFKDKDPDLLQLVNLQKKMLEKASLLLNKDGYIVYMTCSFLEIETVDQINEFLKKNDSFLLSKFKILKDNNNYSKLLKKDCMMTLPDKILNKNIDGYFAAYLKRVK